MTLANGTKIGAYEITGAIGAGGMGEVYRARDTKLGRDVAIKVLPEAFARDVERMARFEREAKVLASLNHPNIAAIYGFEDSGSVRALVMELVEGPTLAERISRGGTVGGSSTPAGPRPRSVPSAQVGATQASSGAGIAGHTSAGTQTAKPRSAPSGQGTDLKVAATQPDQARRIPVDEALRIARQMADALEYAHEHSVVHRDLKPANIKISREDVVKILDFGLAKAIEGDAWSMDIGNSPTLTHMATQTGVLLGTASYMSPEQAKAKPVDRRADIWAFGCVLYEMLTGKMAFHGETISDTLAAVIRAEPDWTLLPKDTPARVRMLLQRCLQKDPKQRLRDVGEARISLDELLSGLPAAAGAPEPSTSGIAATPVPAPFWRRALPWALFGAMALAFAVLAFVHFSARPPAPAQPVRFEIPMPAKTSLIAGSGFWISPNGRELAFGAANSDGTNSLWIRDMGSPEARPLPGTGGSAEVPFFWTADSKYLVFQQGGTLKKIEVSSGSVQPLCGSAGIAIGGSSNRDGVVIFGRGGAGLMSVSANGGPASPLTTLDPSRGEAQHVLPVFLPDGRHFLYLRVSGNPANSGIYAGSLDDPPGKQDLNRILATDVGAEYVPSSSDPNVGQLLFLTSDGTLMAQPFDARRLKLMGEPVPVEEQVGHYLNGGDFSVSNTGILVYSAASATAANDLTWFSREGKVLGTTGEPAAYGDLALSPDGSRAVVTRVDPQTNGSFLWMFDFSRGTSTRFTFGSSASYPIWSPDGKSVIFSSSPGSILDLYQKAANGAGGEELLLKSNEFKLPTDISRDGRFLLYGTFNTQTGADIWVLPLQGDRKPFPFLSTKSNEYDAHFSPDGHWVAYMSEESGGHEIYVRPFSADSNTIDASGGGAKWQVSYGGGDGPQWSADGKELYYLAPGGKVMEVDVTTSPSFQAGTPKLLFQAPLRSGSGIASGDYTVDGKRFLFVAPAQQTGQSPFDVVLNWKAALKQPQ